MKKKRALWFLFRPEDDEYAASVLVCPTRRELRSERSRRFMLGNSQYVCADTFRFLMGFLPKVPTKITLTWEE